MQSIRRHVMLVEALLLQQVLLENRIEFLKTKFLPILQAGLASLQIGIPHDLYQEMADDPGYKAALKARPAQPALQKFLAGKLFDYVVSVDPDPVKKNTQWLLTVISRKTDPMPLEDLKHAGESLSKFAEMRKAKLLPPGKTDINGFKSLSDLNLTLRGEQTSRQTAVASEEQAMLGEAKMIYDGPDYRILVPLTAKAACYFGRNTEWCTAWGNHQAMGLSQQGRHPTRSNRWDDYTSSPLYIIEDKHTQQVWQFSFGSGQFMDVNDRQINLAAFFQQHPKVEEIFNELDGEPVTEIDNYPVYAEGRGFIIKTRKGPMGKIMLRAKVAENGVLEALSGVWANQSYERRSHSIPDPQTIAKLLSDFHITGRPDAVAIYGDELYYRHDKWGTIEEVGDIIYQSLSLVWRQVTDRQSKAYALLDGDHLLISGQLDKADGKLRLDAYTALRTYLKKTGILDPSISEAVTALLLKDSSIVSFVSGTDVSALNLTKEDATKLVETKPSLADIPTAYKVHGPTEAVKEMIVRWCYDEELPIEKDETRQWIGNDLVIERYKNIGAMIDDIGDSGAKWFHKVLDGEDHLEYDNLTADRSNVHDLIKSLSPELLTKLGAYLKSNYQDDIEENFEDFDPASADDVCEAFDLVDDDEIQTKADYAVADGNARGGENEMSEIFKKAIMDNPHIIFETEEGATKKLQWDTPCCFVVAISDLVNFMQQNGVEEAAYTINHEGWPAALEAKIEIEEPHYGFTEYDEEAAKETFADQIGELVD